MGTYILIGLQSNSSFSWLDGLMDWTVENILFVLFAILVLFVIRALLNVLDSYTFMQKKAHLKEHGIEIAKPEKEKGGLSSISDALWAIVPMDRENEIDLNHDYDGIRELDNRLPPWWLYGFYFSIAFAVVYMYIYHFSDIGLNSKEEYEISMVEAEKAKMAYLASQGGGLDETNVELLTDADALAAGKDIYIANCAACHGPDGQGLVGPNFVDKYWVHGGGIKNIFKTIKYGVPAKGMIAWQTQLRPETMQKVASYIVSLEGTNPPNQKAPEGEIWVPEPE